MRRASARSGRVSGRADIKRSVPPVAAMVDQTEAASVSIPSQRSRSHVEGLVHHRARRRASAASGPRPRWSAATASPRPRATPARSTTLVERYGDAVLPLALDVTDKAGVDAAVAQRARALRPPRRRRQQRGLRPVRDDRGGHRGAGARADRDEPVRRAVGHAGGAADPARAGLGPHHPGVLDRRRQGVPEPRRSTTRRSGRWRASASRSRRRSPVRRPRHARRARPATRPTGAARRRSHAEQLPAYDAVREEVAALARDARASSPATRRPPAPAILELVDADEPPLRVFFGTGTLEMIRAEYAKRIENWERWDDLAAARRQGGSRPPHRDTVRLRDHGRGGRRGRRPHRQARGRHRRRVRASASRPPARWPAAGAEVTIAVRDTAAGDRTRRRRRHHRRDAVYVAPARPRRPRRRSTPSPRLGRPAAHPGQQRRRHGDPGADAQRRRAGRCSSPPTTSATSRSRVACTARSPRPAARGSSSVSSSGHLRSPVIFDDLHLRVPRRTTRGAPTGSRRPPTCCSRSSATPALGRRRHHRQRADAGRRSRPTCSATCPRWIERLKRRSAA